MLANTNYFKVNNRNRTYNKRPKNGGKYCVGDRVFYESCNSHVSECLVLFYKGIF